jgi:large subunit ribosomal protein L32
MKGNEMAVPKSKISRSRRGQRRSHDSLKKINAIECPNCGEMKLAHNICPACGFYDGKEVLASAED